MTPNFKFKVRVDLEHPTANAHDLTKKLPTLRAERVSNAGEVQSMKSGRHRTVRQMVWVARLHEDEFLNSSTHDFGATLRDFIDKLRDYRDVFHEIRLEGSARLEIVWFSEGMHSASIIPAGVLVACGSTGLDLDLEYYAPDRPAVESAIQG